MRLNGKVAIISGGARGQGASHAEMLAREGAGVIIGDILDDEGEATARRLSDDGLPVRYLHLDVRLAADWEAAVRLTEERHGRLDVLVNNAGMMTPGDVAEETEENWDQVVAVNQKGQWLGMRAAVPAMRRAGGGSIINVASTFGVRPPAHGVAYAAAKGAVRALTRNAAMALVKDGIRVNCLILPMVDTDFLARARATGGLAKRVRDYPMGRIATPADISPGVVYLASDESSYMTGSELVIDGGLLAGTATRLDEGDR
jgi:3alpha(or 20beta)-hydroxysteroid dehydrogenase